MKEELINLSLGIFVFLLLMWGLLWMGQSYQKARTSECSIYGTDCPPTCINTGQGQDCY